MPLNHTLKMVKLIKLYIMYILPHTKVNCKSVWRILWSQEYCRTVKMLANNAYLNLGENEILHHFSLWEKLSKSNVFWIILYKYSMADGFKVQIYMHLDIYAFRQLSWRRQWHPTPVLLPGKSHGRRSLVGCSPWGRQESDTTEQLPFHFSLSCIGEGNGNPLQCSCLENPRDGGAWWAAIYGVTQSQTRLK